MRTVVIIFFLKNEGQIERSFMPRGLSETTRVCWDEKYPGFERIEYLEDARGACMLGG